MSRKKSKSNVGITPPELREKGKDLASRLSAESNLLDVFQRLPLSENRTLQINRQHLQIQQLLLDYSRILEELLRGSECQVQVLEKENTELREQNELLDYKLKRANFELQRALRVKAKANSESVDGDTPEDTGKKVPPDSDNRKKSTKGDQGRRGAPQGHKGRSRPIPEQVDREEVIASPGICDCGGHRIIPLTEYDEKYIEDIPPVSRIVTRKIFLRGRCSDCGTVLRNPEALHGPPVQIGPNLSVHLALMNQAGMTFGKLSSFASRTLGISLTPAGVLGIVNRVTETLTGPYRQIEEFLRQQNALNGDETGWKVCGRNCYIWCFCNDKMAYFHPDYRRSSAVIEEILGDDFGGVVMCDFYAAYNCLEKTQRCLVHLLRDIAKEREILVGSKLLERFDQAIRGFIDDGLRVQSMPDGKHKEQGVTKLEKQLDRIIAMPVTKGRAETLIKRIDKYRDDLIRFVTHPAIEFHNNRAERQLRPMVITRKISFGSNTDAGAVRYCVLNTIVETCKLQKIDPVEFLRRAYTSDGINTPDLTANSPPAV